MNEAVAVMLVNYFHDLATGLLFGAVVAFFIASRAARGREDFEDLRAVLHRKFRPVVLGALALVVKHVILVSITAASVALFFIRRKNDGKTG
jgi:hypothetical protein